MTIDTQTSALRKMSDTLANHTAQFDKLMHAVLETRTSLEGKIDSIAAEVNILRVKHRKLAEKVTTTESALESVQPDISEMKTKLRHLETEVMQLQKQAEDAEGRSRRGIRRTLNHELRDIEVTLRDAERGEATDKIDQTEVAKLKKQWNEADERLRKFDYRHYTVRLNA
ncbi:hypothetical protein NDU88_005930 [Pleurodeles waltl]|uniref:Uncharacterized protein n=1 Tax=Pleurodeles waltl TaxID=8319 RepID=A0AAV7UKY3_PLEWA|nr:hypothetical protein NDU88_005930 [Pleurodeles waltl]